MWQLLRIKLKMRRSGGLITTSTFLEDLEDEVRLRYQKKMKRISW
jgi:hypothetical protein